MMSAHPLPPTTDAFQLLERAVRVQAISAEITALENPDEIPMRVVEALVRELGLSVASLVMRDPATGTLYYAADVGVPTEIKTMGFRPGGTAETVLRTGQAVFIEDAATDARVNQGARPFFRAWACLPVRHRNQTYGLLFVNFAEPHLFEPIERHILAIFASQTAIALDNARLHRAERQRAAALTALADLGRELSETLEVRELVRILAQSLLRHLPTNAVDLLWVHEEGMLRPALALGLRAPVSALPAIPVSSSRVERELGPAVGPQPVRIQACLDDLGSTESLLPPGPFDGLAIRLSAAGELHGILAILLPQTEGRLDPGELDFLRALADRSALAFHNAALFARTVQAARRDSLTQALNRGAFQRRLEEAFAEARAKDLPLALLMLDADHFKRCNDTHGHAFGDRVLVQLARTVREQIRPTDVLGRLGGEEFAVLLPGATRDTVHRVAERIRGAMESLRLPLPDGREIPSPTVSIGVACLPGPEADADALLETADAALYRAKAQGRNCVCLAPGA